MSILDENTIDGMAYDENKKELTLLLTDHLEWYKNDENNKHHYKMLQNKIDVYLYFIQNHQYLETYKNAMVDKFNIKVAFKEAIDERVIDFFTSISTNLNKDLKDANIDYTVDFLVSSSTGIYDE